MGNCEEARRYARDKLHLAAHEDGIMHWISIAMTAMQLQARAVIERHREAFFGTFGPKLDSVVVAFEHGVRLTVRFASDRRSVILAKYNRPHVTRKSHP